MYIVRLFENMVLQNDEIFMQLKSSSKSLKLNCLINLEIVVRTLMQIKTIIVLAINVATLWAVRVDIVTDGLNTGAARFVRDITGPGITSRFGFNGTDLGIAFQLPNGSGMYLFGDTFNGPCPSPGGWRAPAALRSQTGFTSGTELANGIEWDNAVGGAYAKELVHNDHQMNVAHGPGGSYKFSELTVIPSDGISIGGKVYMFASSVHDWSVIGWITNYCFISVSGDPYGENWVRTDVQWLNDGKVDLRQQITLDKAGDGWVYAVGSSFSRATDGMLLMRVREEDLMNLARWQEWGWSESEGWKWRAPYQGTPFLSDSCGETSLRKIQDTWVLSYYDVKKYAIVTRYTKNIEGEWSEPKVQVVGGTWGSCGDERGCPAGTVAELYGGYIHPASTLDELTLILSQWKTEPYETWPYRSMQFIGSI
jgi:hypothetical protein